MISGRSAQVKAAHPVPGTMYTCSPGAAGRNPKVESRVLDEMAFEAFSSKPSTGRRLIWADVLFQCKLINSDDDDDDDDDDAGMVGHLSNRADPGSRQRSPVSTAPAPLAVGSDIFHADSQ